MSSSGSGRPGLPHLPPRRSDHPCSRALPRQDRLCRPSGVRAGRRDHVVRVAPCPSRWGRLGPPAHQSDLRLCHAGGVTSHRRPLLRGRLPAQESAQSSQGPPFSPSLYLFLPWAFGRKVSSCARGPVSFRIPRVELPEAHGAAPGRTAPGILVLASATGRATAQVAVQLAAAFEGAAPSRPLTRRCHSAARGGRLCSHSHSMFL